MIDARDSGKYDTGAPDWAWRGFVAIAVAGILFVTAFGIFAATGGLGPTKSERISQLEERVAVLEAQMRAKR